MQSPYSMFSTDKNLEQAGIKLDYGAFWIRIARAGGSNKKYERVVLNKLKPYQAQLRTNTWDNSIADKIFKEIYASAVVLGWGSDEFGDGKLVGKDGTPLEFSEENCIKLFSDLPDLFNDVREQAEKVALFKAEEVKEDSKN